MKAKILLLGNWDISKVKTKIKGTYLPNKKIKKHISKNWNNYIKKYPQAFNGQMARLIKWQEKDKLLNLQFELTDYATYVATRDKNLIHSYSPSDRANPLGITMIILTSDNKYIIGRRSLLADQNPGKLYFIGGYIQTDISQNKKNILKNSILNEIKEELNLDKKHIDKITVKCLAYNQIYYHPEIFVEIKLNISRNIVNKKYRQAKDTKEIDKLFFYKKSFLIQKSLNNRLPFKTTLGFTIGLKYLISPISAFSPH